MCDAPDSNPPLSMAALMSLPDAHSVAVSPDGGCLVYLSNASGTHQIWRRELPEGAARQLTDLPEPVGGLAYSPVARDLIFTTDRGGDERHQLWLLPADSETPQPLTQDPATVHAWGCWSPDGRRIAYTCNARDRRVMDVMIMDPTTRDTTQVMTGLGYCEALCFTPDGGTLVIRSSARGPMDQDLWLLDLASGRQRLLLGAAEGGKPTAILAARPSPDGERLLLLCDRDTGFHGLHALHFCNGDLTPVQRFDGQDIEWFALPPGQTRLALVSNAAGYSRLYLGDLTGSPPPVEVTLPAAGVVTSIRFDPDGGALLMTFETARDPSAIWQLELADLRFRKLVTPPRHNVPAHALTAPELAQFTASDGTPLSAFVYRPRKCGSGLAVLFMVHGGPEAQWRPEFRADLQMYLDLGIMVVAPNVRGSTGYGRAFHQMDDQEHRLDAVRDLCDMADAVAAWTEVDASRIGVMGQSYGGYMVLAALCTRPDLWKTGINLYGVSNFITLMKTTGPWRRALRIPEYGDPDRMGAFLTEISPVQHLERLRAPLLLVHATEDPRVPMEQSEQVFAILRGLGHPVDFLRLSGEGHGFARRENRITVFSRIAHFLAETL